MEKDVEKRTQLMREFTPYLPCKCIDTITGNTVEVFGYSHDTGMVEFWAMKGHNDSDWGNIEFFKLILTPLSEITDEDAIIVADLGASSGNGGITYGLQIIRDIRFGRDGVLEVRNAKRFIKIIDFLRSKSYDCGYGSIPSLITAGIAINSKK